MVGGAHAARKRSVRGDVKTALYTPFHLHNEGLTVGLLIALIAVTFPSTLDGSGGSLYRSRVLTVAVVATCVALVLRAANGIVFPFLALALIYGSAVTVFLCIGSSRNALLKSRAFYTISRLSYGMYLLHFTVLRSVSPHVAAALKYVGGQNPVTVLLTLAVTIVSSAIFAAVTFVLIEHPFLIMRDRMLGRSAPAAVAPSYVPVMAPAGVYASGGDHRREEMRAEQRRRDLS